LRVVRTPDERHGLANVLVSKSTAEFKWVAFGFTDLKNFRIRALLYAGKPNFRGLDSIVMA
jgi:hypothetical protein